MRRWLTPKEAAQILPQTEQVIRKYLREGKIPGRKIFERWAVDMQALGMMEDEDEKRSTREGAPKHTPSISHTDTTHNGGAVALRLPSS